MAFQASGCAGLLAALIALSVSRGVARAQECSGSGEAEGSDGTCRVAVGIEDLGLSYVSYLRDKPRTAERPMGAKFRNFYDEDLEMFWDNGSARGVYSGVIYSQKGSSTLSYEGHTFIFRRKGSGEEVARITMQTGKSLYIIPPNKEATKESAFYKKTMEEVEFLDKYYKQNGYPWLAFYPRDKPVLPFRDANYLGQNTDIASDYGHLKCTEPGKKECGWADNGMDLRLKVISLKPRVFLIQDLLSPVETEYILNEGERLVKRSTVGHGASAYTADTRTSKNGWIRRTHSEVMEHIFRRFANVLGIDEQKLQHHETAERLQVVHYTKGQQYTPHHDFGDNGSVPNHRFLTLFIYIKAAEKEGGTSFPKAYDGRGMKVLPKAGSALLWYNMLPDGNADDMSLHAGMPVGEGEKWACNLWVWDPKVTDSMPY